MTTAPPRSVLAILGTGDIGRACARRLAHNRIIFLGDISQTNLDSAASSLRQDGHQQIHAHIVDVSSFSSVQKFAQSAAASGPIETIVHTAGLSPVMASTDRILQVDLLGTANVIDAFYDVLPPSSPSSSSSSSGGTTLTAIASIARLAASPSPELSQHLATAPRDTLLSPALTAGKEGLLKEELERILQKGGPTAAYALSKAANFLRVQAAARKWSAHRGGGGGGARINTVSPGLILTAMTREEERVGGMGPFMQGMMESTPLGRGGTADEVASVVAFLASAEASFVTGSDLLVDGGFVAGNGGFAMPGDEEGAK